MQQDAAQENHHQEQGKLDQHFENGKAGCFSGISRRDGHVSQAGADQVKLTELRNLEEIAFVDAFKRKPLEHFAAQGQEAIGWVETVPIACGRFSHETQADIADAAYKRHLTKGQEISKTIALGKIRLAGNQGRDQGRDVVGGHLPVAIQLHNNLRAQFEGFFVAADHRAAHALVFLVGDNADAPIAAGGCIDDLGRAVRRGVVGPQ